RARACRVADRRGSGRRGGAAARGGARDLRAAQGDAVARPRRTRVSAGARCGGPRKSLLKPCPTPSGAPEWPGGEVPWSIRATVWLVPDRSSDPPKVSEEQV